ncbi:MAG: hypothetical protein M1838_001391 [Thelocarpon superellum]|nr:MAG: hypothetical protein M1838_001391 [Thelocarpon superellum]
MESEEDIERSEEAEAAPPPRKRVKVQATISSMGALGAASAANSTSAKKRPTKRAQDSRNTDTWTYKAGIREELPPMHDIGEIFEDLTRAAREQGLMKAVEHLRSNKLKVATMCSGTESPILALQLVNESLNKLEGRTLDFEHQFSAEIVPYKQAYIERNFSPPIIFRDIRELVDSTTATTAYGARAEIPADVDLLVAGFSCVDFSNLNTKRQTLSAGGESGDTFQAVYQYARAWRPPLIVLENVCSAPWEDIQILWGEIGYNSRHVRLDTKQYYIPHTRQRGYMICVDRKKLAHESVVERWEHLMSTLSRPASSSIEAFLLHEDDPRVHRGRAELARGMRRGDDDGPRDVDWTKCQGRHQDYRADLFLGAKRPLTGWEDNGSCRMPDYAWGDWGVQQVERIWDTFEISFLRNVRRGFDSQYKTRVWELSQNIDRFTDTTPFGITACITPTGYPFVTNRGGPMIGLEALAMQGLPIEKLLLTRESQKNLQDLAGNAMTSTVVGAAILAALIVGHRAIPQADGDPMPVDAVDVQHHLRGDDALVLAPLDLGNVAPIPVPRILHDAVRSARLCLCEGRALMTSNKLRRCVLCHHTTCEQCGGNPSHRYEVIARPELQARLPPANFEDQLKNALPMRIAVEGLTLEGLQTLQTTSKISVDDAEWDRLASSIAPALGVELRFHSLKRAQTWTVTYDAPTARMELILDGRQAEWRVFGKPEAGLPGNDPVRRLLARPFARMRPTRVSLLSGTWQFCLPLANRFTITVTGQGTLLRSWESKLGLTESRFADKQVWSSLHVAVDPSARELLDMAIEGDYDLLQDCATASGSLHKKRISHQISAAETAPMFLFLDPTRLGDPARDPFVFSTDIRRLTYGEIRQVVATVDATWRPSHRFEPEKVPCVVEGRWISSPSTSLVPVRRGQDASFAVPPHPLPAAFVEPSCNIANTILSCRVQLPCEEHIGWGRGDWVEVDKPNESGVFTSFAWLTERVRRIQGLATWNALTLGEDAGACAACAPPAPGVKWEYSKNKWRPYEDPQQAAPYEHALKNRPSPFLTQVRIDEKDVGMLRVGLNVWSLVHRAMARLPGAPQASDMTVAWRLLTNYVAPPQVTFPPLTLRSNKSDPPSTQPPHFRTPLRPEQLRSVHWMRRQEADEVAPFLEEEVEEALQPQLGWRAEARATTAITVRGGVLADQVGYGKTATTLGLIDLRFQEERDKPLEEIDGKIWIRATLIIVPATLVDQWANEVKKFLGSTYRVLIIKIQKDLARLSVRDFQQAHIIITTWPIFNNVTYLAKLAQFAALPDMPSTSGRAFDAWYAQALARVSEHVPLLRTKGATAFRQHLRAAMTATEREEKLRPTVPSKRLRGQAYQKAKAAGATGKASPKKGRHKRNLSDLSDLSDSPATPVVQTDPDPFKLQTPAAKQNWVEMKCPLFQMFHFNRVVVDEYTYVAGKDHTCLVNLAATCRWVLSGTPPLEEFADIKSISVFLGIHLGIQDDSAGFMKEKTIRAIQSERTDVEKFQAFKQVRSPAWHERRHEVAQMFLDRFVRQNIAEIDEIPFCEILRPVTLPAAERAIYLELHCHLMSQDMRIRQGKSRAENDRVKRLTETLGSSKTAEEALLKASSHFTLHELEDGRENATQACDLVVVERERQLAEVEADLQMHLRHAAWLKRQCKSDDKHFEGWKKNVASGAFGDAPSERALQAYVAAAEKASSAKDGNEFYTDTDVRELQKKLGARKKKAAQGQKKAGKRSSRNIKGKGKATRRPFTSRKRKGDADDTADDEECDDDRDLDSEAEDNAIDAEESGMTERMRIKSSKSMRLTTTAQKVQALRELAGQLRRLSVEFVSRRRSLRFFQVVRALQRAYSGLSRGGQASAQFECSACGKAKVSPSDLWVLTLCGHTACQPCLDDPQRHEECGVTGCSAAARGFHVVGAAELGEEDADDREGRHYGRKLEEMVHLIKDEIPADDQVLLFVQYDDLMEKVAEALTDNGISNLALTNHTHKPSSSMMSQFQQETGSSKKKVLVLNVGTESASGANLTNANHIIFLSPFLTTSQYAWDSSTTQAIGRARRYGQKKMVHIYRFVSLKTIDVDILESRAHQKLVRDAVGAFALVDLDRVAQLKAQGVETGVWTGGLLKYAGALAEE